jgi:hypothetical protein
LTFEEYYLKKIESDKVIKLWYILKKLKLKWVKN